MTGAQFIARVYQILGLPSTHPEVVNGVIADNYLARVDELTLLVKPPTMRAQVTRAIVANSATIYLPADLLQTIKVKMADANGDYYELAHHTPEDLDAVSATWDSSDTGDVTSYTYRGIVTSTGSNSYGQRIIQLSPTPTTSDSDGLLVRYWKRATDLISSSSSQYQIVEVPRAYQMGLAYGVAGLIAIDPRINRDPGTFLGPWNEMLTRYLQYGPEHREYDYNATAYSSIATAQARHWSSF